MKVIIKNLKFQYSTDNSYCLNIDNILFNPGINFLAGNNGAGKTTFLKILFGLLEYKEGSITFNEISHRKECLWRSKVASYLSNEYLPPYLTVEEFLLLVCRGYGKVLEKNKMFPQVRKLLDETYSAKKTIRELSNGNKVKVGLAATLLSGAKLLLWDEPYANLDVHSRYLLNTTIIDYKSKYNANIIISTHDIHDIGDVAERIFYIQDGKLTFLSNLDVERESRLCLLKKKLIAN